MSDKVDELIETIEGQNKQPITFQQMFKSLWGGLSLLVSFIAVMVVVATWVFNTFPTNTDLKDKFVAKQEYYTKLKETKEPIDKEIDSLKVEIEKLRKVYESDVRKLRLEYRVERMHDLGQQLKIVDDKLRDHPEDPALKSYREAIWKEYNRIRNKIDEGVKEID